MERKPKVIIAIQARSGSTRLKNKLFAEISGKTAINHLIERVKRSREVDAIVLATTAEAKDDILEKVARDNGISCFRGPEKDLVTRLLGAAKNFNADAIARITADHTLLDAETVDLLVREYKKRDGGVDFLTNCLPLTFPQGYNIEIISRRALEAADRDLKILEEREAFIFYFARNPEKFLAYIVKNDKDLSNYRFSLDYPEDLQLITKIYEHFYKNGKNYFNLSEIINFLDANPALLQINSYRTDRTKYPFNLGDAALRKAL